MVHDIGVWPPGLCAALWWHAAATTPFDAVLWPSVARLHILVPQVALQHLVARCCQMLSTPSNVPSLVCASVAKGSGNARLAGVLIASASAGLGNVPRSGAAEDISPIPFLDVFVVFCLPFSLPLSLPSRLLGDCDLCHVLGCCDQLSAVIQDAVACHGELLVVVADVLVVQAVACFCSASWAESSTFLQPPCTKIEPFWIDCSCTHSRHKLLHFPDQSWLGMMCFQTL